MAKTRLLKGEKVNIRHAVLKDIPRIAYNEKIRVYIQKRAIEDLPEALRNHLSYLENEFISLPNCNSCYVKNNEYCMTAEDRAWLASQLEEQKKQEDAIDSVARTLRGILDSFRYVEDFVKAHPEFAKYVSQPPEPIVNLPAVDLTEKLHALGWPKSDEGK